MSSGHWRGCACSTRVPNALTRAAGLLAELHDVEKLDLRWNPLASKPRVAAELEAGAASSCGDRLARVRGDAAAAEGHAGAPAPRRPGRRGLPRAAGRGGDRRRSRRRRGARAGRAAREHGRRHAARRRGRGGREALAAPPGGPAGGHALQRPRAAGVRPARAAGRPRGGRDPVQGQHRLARGPQARRADAAARGGRLGAREHRPGGRRDPQPDVGAAGRGPIRGGDARARDRRRPRRGARPARGRDQRQPRPRRRRRGEPRLGDARPRLPGRRRAGRRPHRRLHSRLPRHARRADRQALPRPRGGDREHGRRARQPHAAPRHSCSARTCRRSAPRSRRASRS